MTQLSWLEATAGGALFSPDRRHRLKLWRTWSTKPVILWVMCNPSVADEKRLDPTLRRCESFSRAWGYGGMMIGNLFTLVSPYPEDLLKAECVIDPAADRALLEMADGSARIVIGWGVPAVDSFATRAHDVLRLLATAGGVRRELWCLGTTKDGWPRHPLYRHSETPLELYG